MRRFRYPAVALGLGLLTASLHADVTVVGRRLMVNGQAFTVQGVDYSPTPVGRTLGAPGGDCIGPYAWWSDRPTYISDFPLIHRMGANTLRTYGIMNSGNSTSDVLAALTAAQTNGLYVVMSYFVSTSANLADAATQNTIRTEVLAAVNTYKSHPAVLMWNIGNEVNLNNGNGSAAWYSFVNTLAGQIEAADGHKHPVTTTQGECPQCAPAINFQIGSAGLGTTDAAMTNLDLWSVTAYRGKTFEGIFQTLATNTTKPIFVAEFGKDAYHDATAQEDSAMQASYINPQWTEISQDLSAVSVSNALVGGAVFEWTDEWWKASGNPCLSHDTGSLFTRPDDTLDPIYNEEWFGITGISTIDAITNPSGSNRSQRQAYATLQSFWNPAGAGSNAGGAASFFADTVRNYPNPLIIGQTTKFVFLTNEAGSADVRIYDAAGQFVTSFDAPIAGAGRVEVTWDGRNRQGALVSPGLYIAKIHGHSAGHDETQFRRIVGVK